MEALSSRKLAPGGPPLLVAAEPVSDAASETAGVLARGLGEANLAPPSSAEVETAEVDASCIAESTVSDELVDWLISIPPLVAGATDGERRPFALTAAASFETEAV